MDQDDSDEFSEFLITRQPSDNVKSYSNSNTSKKAIKNEAEEEEATNKNHAVKEALTTKKAVELLLNGSLRHKVCRYCLNVSISAPLYELDEVFQINGQGALYKVTVRDMIASFYPFKTLEDPNFPNRICDKCLDNTISSYLFTQQCERSGRALRNCFEDIYEKLDKLDPLNPPKKRGRQKLHPNHNTLYCEHEKVIHYADPIINLINRGIEITEEDKYKINELECPKCSEILPNIESLINHERIHPKSMWFNCRLCGKSFPKRHLYRKHIKTVHVLGQQLASKNNDFKCTDCGVTSDVYDKHLQHIEKHKFQTIMEHLIERTMDKLCIVCMSKGNKMVDLDKTVSLHGGCPELTGQKSLYNILGSTMPEQNSYEYRELLIPYKAKILELIKKKNKNVKDFILSNLIIISELALNCDEYLFTKPIKVNDIPTLERENANANTPLEENFVNESNEKSVETYEIQEIKICDNELKNTTENNLCIENEQYLYITKSKANNDAFPIVTLESKETFDNDTNNVEEKVNEEANIVKTCKVCWIFKKPSCKTCVENAKFNKDTDQNKSCDVELRVSDENDAYDNSLSVNKRDTIIAPNCNCKYCWIFKNTKKCNHCKKECNSFCYEDSKNTGISKDENIRKKKRKITPNLNFNSKKIKWQCNICLTQNANNERCICCDSQKYNDSDQVKILFGLNKYFFNTPDDKKSADTVKSEMQPNGNSIVLEDKPIITTSVVCKDDANMKSTMLEHDLNETHEIETVYPQLDIMDIDINMDTEIGDIIHNSDESVVKLSPQEEMDIEENFTSEAPTNFSPTNPTFSFTTTAELTSNFTATAKALNFVTTTNSTSNIITTTDSNFATKLEFAPNFETVVKPNIQSNIFNFNMGMAPIDDGSKGGTGGRRIKRPLRRMATNLHK